MPDVARSYEALQRAEAKVREAEAARDTAREMLDVALASVGWTRLRGAFYPDATPLYVNVLYPGATLTVDQVTKILEQQKAAAV